MVETTKSCRNCGADLSGEYCAQCGQREGRADQRFLDLAGELTGDLLDWDSRAWRTLVSLLFRPGHLSAEFIVGRRASYLPPLRLYLIISFILFLVISINAGDSLTLGQGEDVDSAGPGVVVTLDPNDVAVVTEELSEVLGEEVAHEISDAIDRQENSDGSDSWSGDIDMADENSPVWLKDLDQHLEGNVKKLRGDPSEFVKSMVDYLPQMMFLLLPLFALLIQAVYLFSNYHYLQHLVFSLNYHSFAYLLYLIVLLVEYLGVYIDGLVGLAMVIYLPLAFRRTYGSGWGGAIGKSMFVFLAYAVLLAMGFAAVAFLALVLL